MACVFCGVEEGTTVAAHYSGKYSSQVGKGGSEKGWDHVSAWACADCHSSLDSYAEGNDDSRAIKFFLAIFETQRRLFEEGVLVVRRR